MHVPVCTPLHVGTLAGSNTAAVICPNDFSFIRTMTVDSVDTSTQQGYHLGAELGTSHSTCMTSHTSTLKREEEREDVDNSEGKYKLLFVDSLFHKVRSVCVCLQIENFGIMFPCAPLQHEHQRSALLTESEPMDDRDWDSHHNRHKEESVPLDDRDFDSHHVHESHVTEAEPMDDRDFDSRHLPGPVH